MTGLFGFVHMPFLIDDDLSDVGPQVQLLKCKLMLTAYFDGLACCYPLARFGLVSRVLYLVIIRRKPAWANSCSAQTWTDQVLGTAASSREGGGSSAGLKASPRDFFSTKEHDHQTGLQMDKRSGTGTYLSCTSSFLPSVIETCQAAYKVSSEVPCNRQAVRAISNVADTHRDNMPTSRNQGPVLLGTQVSVVERNWAGQVASCRPEQDRTQGAAFREAFFAGCLACRHRALPAKGH